jgi:hypothetical protein
MKGSYLSLPVLFVFTLILSGLPAGTISAPAVEANQVEHHIYLPGLLVHQPGANLLWMSFDEGPGATSFRDDSPYRHDGACQGTACPASGSAGRLGNALRFDGLDDSILIEPASTQAISPAEDFSVEALIFLESTSCGYCRILNRSDGVRGFNFDAGDGTGRNKLSLYINDGGRHSLTRSTQELTLNEWHHVAAVYSRRNDQVRLYINGVETKYEIRQDPSGIGDISTPTPLIIGKMPGEGDSFQGLFKHIGLYKKAFSGAEIRSLALTQLPGKTPGYSRWSSGQAVRVLAAFDLPVEGATSLTSAGYSVNPVPFNEATRFSLPTTCTDCGAVLYSFARPQDLEAARSYLRSLGHTSPRLFSQDNLLVQIDRRVPESQALDIQTALHDGVLEEMVRRVQDGMQVEYEPWSQYYATDRGQQKNPATGESQRTYDRWEAEDNVWIFGQSTWLYQNPAGGDEPPQGMPSTYSGNELDYYYHYHCEQDPAAEPSQDCLNWQIYIELLTQGANDTEIANWARGGWKRHTPSSPEWEVFYKAGAFDGRCDKEYIQANFDDAYLLDPANKVPLLLRLPSVPGIVDKSPKFCTVIFAGYQQKAADIVRATFWYTTSQMLSKQFDNGTQRYVIQARNLYFEYHTVLGRDAIYKLFGEEVYTMRQVKPENSLLYGLEAFWWGAWGGTPELDADRDVDPTWSELQWCQVDYTQGPAGLGVLVCDP